MKNENIKELLKTVQINEQKKIFMEKFNALPKEIKEQLEKEYDLETLLEGDPRKQADFLRKAWNYVTGLFGDGARTANDIPAGSVPPFNPATNPNDFNFIRKSDGSFGIDDVPNAQKPGPRVGKDPNAIVPVTPVTPEIKPPSVVRLPDDPTKKTGNLIRDLIAGTAVGAGVGYGINALTGDDKEKAAADQPAAPANSNATTFRQAENDSMEKLKALNAETPPAEEPTKYKVASGDTLSQLAQKNKVSVADILKANQDIKDVHKIGVGQELVIPKATNNPIYQYGIGTKSGPSQSQNVPMKKVNESLLAAFNDVVNSKSPNLFAEAAKKGSVPKTEKEKSLAALAEPKDKITHKDVLVGRGVVKEDNLPNEASVKKAKGGVIQSGGNLTPNSDISAIPTALAGGGTAAGGSLMPGYEDEEVPKNTTMVYKTPAVNSSGKGDLGVKKTQSRVPTNESLFSDKEIAFFEAIAPTPKKYAPNGTDKTNATGSKSGTLSDTNEEIEHVAEGRKSEEESLGDNMLHMSAKRAADNMANVKHKFASGEVVNMTKGMAVSFLNRHAAAKTADEKDAILKHANKSLDAFKSITQGGAVPKEEAPKIKLGTMKGK